MSTSLLAPAYIPLPRPKSPIFVPPIQIPAATQGNIKAKPKRSTKPRLYPASLFHLTQTIFSPNFRPIRNHPIPKPPSIAASRLPPPAAEVDERPRWRIRRFRMWRDAAPGLRVAVLDPRKRIHLRRYQPFNTPTPPLYFRGQFRTPINHHPQPHTTPAIITPFIARPPAVPRILTKWERGAQFKRLMACKYTLDMEHERRFRKGMTGLVEQIVEFERDWCVGEGVDGLGVNGRGGVKWKEGVDVERIEKFTQFFKSIRQSSNNIFNYLDPSESARVPQRDDVKRKIKEAENAKEQRKEERRLRRLRESEAVVSGLVGGDAQVSTIVQGMTDHPAEMSPTAITHRITAVLSGSAAVGTSKLESQTLSPAVGLGPAIASPIPATPPESISSPSVTTDQPGVAPAISSPKSKKKKSKSKKPKGGTPSLLVHTEHQYNEDPPSAASTTSTDSELLVTPNDGDSTQIQNQLMSLVSKLSEFGIDQDCKQPHSSLGLKKAPGIDPRQRSQRPSNGREIVTPIYHMIRIDDGTGKNRTILVQAPKGRPLNLEKLLPKIMTGYRPIQGEDGEREPVEVDPAVGVSKDRMANLVDMVEVPLQTPPPLPMQEEPRHLSSVLDDDKPADSSVSSTNLSEVSNVGTDPLHWAYKDNDTELYPVSLPHELADADMDSPNEAVYAFHDPEYEELDDKDAGTVQIGYEERRRARDTLMSSSIHSSQSERLRWVC